MPVLGYLGYLPFGLEVYVLYVFLIDMTGNKKSYFYGGANYFGWLESGFRAGSS
jgi:hypothetical protein